jgi:hypothetical protein
VYSGRPTERVLYDKGGAAVRSTGHGWQFGIAANRIATIGVGIFALVCAGSLAGQQPLQLQSATGAAQPTGTVTGQVIAQDTQLPARFAQITLQNANSAAGGGGGFGGSLQARTGVDGTFEANVAPGDYYVMASAPGYSPERSLLLADVAAGADPADLLARIPVVHVGPDSVNSVIVSMERGGTIAGRVLWEDGSPAAGISVVAMLNGPTATLPAALQQIRSSSVIPFGITDDRGAYRLSGLTTGDYVVQALIQDRPQFGGFGGFGGAFSRGRGGSSIRVYSPGVFHKADAKPIAVRAGEEHDDLRFVIDLRGLHMVSGHATSVSAGQSIESGRVRLVDPTDNSLNLNGLIDAHGDFSVAYVPPGSYTLEVSGASTQASTNYRGRGGALTSSASFQPLSQPLVVSDTDVTGVSAMLTPAASNSH